MHFASEVTDYSIVYTTNSAYWKLALPIVVKSDRETWLRLRFSHTMRLFYTTYSMFSMSSMLLPRIA